MFTLFTLQVTHTHITHLIFVWIQNFFFKSRDMKNTAVLHTAATAAAALFLFAGRENCLVFRVPNVKLSAYQISIQRELKKNVIWFWFGGLLEIECCCIRFAASIGNVQRRRRIGKRVTGSRREERLEWSVHEFLARCGWGMQQRDGRSGCDSAADRKATMNQAERQNPSVREGFLGRKGSLRVSSARQLLAELATLRTKYTNRHGSSWIEAVGVRCFSLTVIAGGCDCLTPSLWTVAV